MHPSPSPLYSSSRACLHSLRLFPAVLSPAGFSGYGPLREPTIHLFIFLFLSLFLPLFLSYFSPAESNDGGRSAARFFSWFGLREKERDDKIGESSLRRRTAGNGTRNALVTLIRVSRGTSLGERKRKESVSPRVLSFVYLYSRHGFSSIYFAVRFSLFVLYL